MASETCCAWMLSKLRAIQLKRATYYMALFTLGTMLAACSHENKYRAELASPLKANAASGVIVISAGSTKPCGLFATPTGLRIFSAKGPFTPYAALATLDVNNPNTESEFSDHHGRLYVISLPSGKYVLAPFLIHPYADYVKPLQADFEVRSQEIVYLGELFMPECQGDSKMAFQDQEIRDRELLQTKNPAFADVPITKRLLMFTSRRPFLRSVLPF